MDLDHKVRQAPRTFSASVFRSAIMFFLPFTVGSQLVALLLRHRFDPAFLLGGAIGTLISAIINKRRRRVEVSDTYIEGPQRARWSRSRFGLSEIDRAGSGWRAWGNVRIQSRYGDYVLVDYASFSRRQRKEILRLLGLSNAI